MTTRMVRWAAYVAIVALSVLTMWALHIHRLQHQLFFWIIVLAVARLAEPVWKKAAQRFANRSAKPS